MKQIILLLSFFFGIGTLAAEFKTPSVSANALFLYRNSNFHKEDTDALNPDQLRNGFNMQEAEIQFYSDVDPYTRLKLLLAVHPEYVTDGTSVEESWVIEPEEAFAESNAVSGSIFKVGKFKAYMGKNNILHTHAFPFVDAPLANTALLGDEGLNDLGASASVLLPSSWFNEITLQFFRGEGENAQFNSATPSDGVGLVHWKNLFDLTEALTLEIGLSYAGGANSLAGTTSLSGADLTFKWRPTDGGKYRSFSWSTEYLARTQTQTGASDETGNGLATWVQYQFAERWSALYRYDSLSVENSFDPVALPNDSVRRNSAGVVFAPSEFSSYKIEFNQRTGGLPSAIGETTENSVLLQANFTIGAHPAHSY